MSYLHVQQLGAVAEEFIAARAAVSYARRLWPQIAGTSDMQDVRLSHVQLAAQNIEGTFIIRLFADYETLLQEFLAVRYPGAPIPRHAESLINRVARLRRVPDPVRDGAHDVRSDRDLAVHHGAVGAPALSFTRSLSLLNRFLVRL